MQYTYVSSGFEPSEKNTKEKKHIIGNFTTEINWHNEAISVIMTTDDMWHRFIFPKTTLMNFYWDQPFHSRYAVPAIQGALMKSANRIRWTKDSVQFIRNDARTETIVDVIAKPTIVGINEWEFDIDGDDNSINDRYSNIIRFIAFAYAFDQALKESVKGRHYTDLYRAICFGT